MLDTPCLTFLPPYTRCVELTFVSVYRDWFNWWYWRHWWYRKHWWNWWHRRHWKHWWNWWYRR